MKSLCNSIFILTIIAFTIVACKQKKTLELRVMSYNIKHGVGIDDTLDLSRAKRVIKSISPDLCGLQEIDNYCERSDNVGQVEYLSENTSLQGTFGKFMDYQGGEYGMATLANKRLLYTKILPLPDGKYEPRTSIVHRVELAKGAFISFANVHFDWIDGEEGESNRLLQAKTLVKYLDSLELPSIITGDFNCTPDSPTMKWFDSQGFVFAEKGNDNLSFQGKVQVEIDHLIYRNAKTVNIKVNAIDLLDEPTVSDHRPLVVDLDVMF